jgi:hypothetical protein
MFRLIIDPNGRQATRSPLFLAFRVINVFNFFEVLVERLKVVVVLQ